MYLKRKMKPQLLGNVSYISKWQRIMGLGKAHWDPVHGSCVQQSATFPFRFHLSARESFTSQGNLFRVLLNFSPLLNLLPVTSPH